MARPAAKTRAYAGGGAALVVLVPQASSWLKDALARSLRFDRAGALGTDAMSVQLTAWTHTLLLAVVPFSVLMTAIGIVSAWGVIVLCQLKLWSWAKAGRIERPAFRMPFAPWSGVLTLVFLLAVLVLMAFDHPVGTWTIASLVVIVPLLALGWRAARPRVEALAARTDQD